jgi:electron transport complex protein RnfD
MKDLLTVSAPPHMRSRMTTGLAVRLVMLALLPVLFHSVFRFGLHALAIIVLSILSCLASEVAMLKVMRRRLSITDGSAVLTGLLLSFTLPPAVPLWMPVLGGVFAITIAKQLFGGFGHNFVNPALAGRAFLQVSWPSIMNTAWMPPNGGTLSGLDTVTSATPLTLLKSPAYFGMQAADINTLNSTALKELFLGRVGGCIGETSAVLLLVGGLFLVLVNVADLRIVTGYLCSFGILALSLPTKGNLLFHMFSGGLILGAFFMATDWVTTPVTKKGRWIFGAGCGILTIIIRVWGSYPEGVCYAILIMNVFTPLIDSLTGERVLGSRRYFTGTNLKKILGNLWIERGKM